MKLKTFCLIVITSLLGIMTEWNRGFFIPFVLFLLWLIYEITKNIRRLHGNRNKRKKVRC